jgi:hypothetical protein
MRRKDKKILRQKMAVQEEAWRVFGIGISLDKIKIGKRKKISDPQYKIRHDKKRI